MVGSSYKLLRKIASGGMAEVFLALQQGLAGFEKLVVVKKVHSHLCEDGKFIQMFLDEARLAASLSHPNIVQIFDIRRDEESFFIAMEYLSGEDLRYVIGTHRNRQALIPVPLALRIAADTAAGLHAAHTATDAEGNPRGIVHRDVCPSNIIVCFNGITKLLDFGLAKANVQNIYSRPGTLKGKFAYISPEQIEHKDLDARSDVFSLGVVLWEMLTSTRLFKGPNEAAVLRSVMEDVIKPPSSLNANVPRQADDIAMSALERDRDKRIQTADEICDALEKVMKQIGESVSNHHVGEWMQKTFKERHQQRRELEKGANVDLAASGGIGGAGSGSPPDPGVLEPSPPDVAPAPVETPSPPPPAKDRDRGKRIATPPAPAPTAVPTATAPVERAPQKGESKGGMLVVALVLALLLAGGAGYFLLLDDEEPTEPVATATEPGASEPASHDPGADPTEPEPAPPPRPAPEPAPAPAAASETDDKPEKPEPPGPPAPDDDTATAPAKKKASPRTGPARRARARSGRRARRYRPPRPEPRKRTRVGTKPEPRVAAPPQPVAPPAPKYKPTPAVPPPPKTKAKTRSAPPQPEPKPKVVAAKPKPVTPPPPKPKRPRKKKKKKKKKTTGKIRVLSDAPGFVFVDGHNTGQSTPALVELPAGPHTVIVVLKGTNTRITHRVKVKPGKIHRIRLRGAP